MPIYTNKDGTRSQLITLCHNLDGSRKTNNSIFANISGSSKQIYAAQKYHYWKVYKVNNWEIAKTTDTKYCSDTESYGDIYSEGASWSGSLYSFSSYSTYDYTNSSTGKRTFGVYLSSPIALQWSDAEKEELGNAGYRDMYDLDASWKGTYYYDPGVYNSSIVISEAYHLTGGSMSCLYNASGENVASYTVFSYDHIIYAKPTSYAGSYTLVKTKTKALPNMSGYATVNSDGSYPTSYMMMKNLKDDSTSDKEGYGAQECTYTGSSGSQYVYRYSYDGYYYVYDGYRY